MPVGAPHVRPRASVGGVSPAALSLPRPPERRAYDGRMTPARPRSTGAIAAAAALDAALIIGFAATGRGSHAEGVGLVGVLGTAWPFLAGGAVAALTLALFLIGWRALAIGAAALRRRRAEAAAQ